MTTTWQPVPGLAFGGDYNPEQWPRETWDDDVRLMREAGVSIVTLGVFSWGLLEVADDAWDLGWLDEVIDLLHANGIAVDLATPTASPPIWLHHDHPEILPVNRSGLRYHQGGRLQWCPSSPVFRDYATRVATVLGRRYATHPAVRLWHVSNELGGGNRHCYCEVSSEHFRRWLEQRYGTVAALNDAWGTAFWGHRYASFDQVICPLDSETTQNPGLLLDFDRFSSDALLEHFLAEKTALREAGVTAPITTNLMVGARPSVADYASWAPHLDVIANDHYTIAADPRRERDLGYAADRSRGLASGQPWLLMEHSTGAVNWQPRNRAKAPGELVRNSLAHIARGADGALFFQWRASLAGAEQWHSAMVPHAGTRTRIWREVCELGRILQRIGEVAGSVVAGAQAAILADDVSGWAWGHGQKPLNGFPLHSLARAWSEALTDRGVTSDVVPPEAPLSGYRLVVVPGLYLASDATAEAVAEAACGGATVLVTHLSGVVDEHSRVREGGYPGAFRDLVGAFAEEYLPLQADERVSLDTGWTATDWTESLVVTDAEVVGRYESGPLAGSPALTRREVGTGTAWYCSAGLEADSLDRLVATVLTDAGIAPDVPVAPGLEAVRRISDDHAWLFLLNHSTDPVTVDATGQDLVTATGATGHITLAAGAVAVVRER